MTQPDAYLIHLGEEMRTLCASQDQLTDQADGLSPKDPGHDPLWTRIYAGTDRFHAILNEMRDTPATTTEGMRVKAAAVLRWMSPGGETPADHEDGRVAWSLAMDVLGRPEAAEAPHG